MDWKLELMVLPVSDVDRAKDFYADKLGFNVDVDHSAGDAFRVVQLTPPGSACSISVGKGITESTPGSVQGMHLVVADIDKARSSLVERGVEASEIFHFGANGRESGPHPERAGLRLVRHLQRPRRQRLARPGGPSGRLAGMTGAVELDERAFEALAQRHRRELHVHCYRMLASFEEAEDAVQEVFLRAWRGRDTLDDDSMLRAWLYRIATNVCIDMIRSRSRRVADLRSFAEVPWLQPYPDRLLDEIAPADDQPDAVVIERETIELAFLAALQVLPPRQRAALILRDVLGRPAVETAALLDTSVAAANSALQRARSTMQEHLPSHRVDWAAREPSADELVLLEQFIDAHERCDAAAAVAIASQDLRITMPPQPFCFDGLDAIAPLARDGLRGGARTGTGDSCPRWPTACRPPRATCGDRATASSAPSSSTCCASRTAPSPRSRPSATRCSRPSVSRRRCSSGRRPSLREGGRDEASGSTFNR